MPGLLSALPAQSRVGERWPTSKAYEMRNEMTQSNRQRMNQPREIDESSLCRRTVRERTWYFSAGT